MNVSNDHISDHKCTVISMHLLSINFVQVVAICNISSKYMTTSKQILKKNNIRPTEILQPDGPEQVPVKHDRRQ